MRLPWSPRAEADPYEDFYRNAAPRDPRNLIVNRLREAPDGGVFAVKAETHTPEVMASHVKEMGRFFGADLTCIVKTDGLGIVADGEEEALSHLPFAVLMLFRSEFDSRDAPGIGGNAVALAGAHATFQVAAIIREYGYEARRVVPADRDGVAARAGLGSLDDRGRLKTRQFGTKQHVADIILTDLPVAVDG